MQARLAERSFRPSYKPLKLPLTRSGSTSAIISSTSVEMWREPPGQRAAQPSFIGHCPMANSTTGHSQPRRVAAAAAATAAAAPAVQVQVQAVNPEEPEMVLKMFPMLSDMVKASKTGSCWESVAWKAALDIILPILCLWALFKVLDWAADQARKAIQRGVEGDGDVVAELRKRSTLAALVLLSLRNPASFVLPPWLLAYTVRTALHIVDLVSHKYRPQLPAAVAVVVGKVSDQLIPLDALLLQILSSTGVLFAAWFFVQLKDILVREIILVRAVRSGRKELERVYVPLSSLITWAVVVASIIAVCTSLKVDLKPLLAVGGAGGIAAGFASQQLLSNIVSGINIFLTRPFVIGDQVVFTGMAPDVEGTVEAVEITRTILRTADGTLVAVPNKMVADMIVYNRTRMMTAAPAVEAAAAAAVVAAAPLRRVLCFTLQLARDAEPRLGEVRSEVAGYLQSATKQQLKKSGLTKGHHASADSSMEEEGGQQDQDAANEDGSSTAEPSAAADGRGIVLSINIKPSSTSASTSGSGNGTSTSSSMDNVDSLDADAIVGSNGSSNKGSSKSRTVSTSSNSTSGGSNSSSNDGSTSVSISRGGSSSSSTVITEPEVLYTADQLQGNSGTIAAAVAAVTSAVAAVTGGGTNSSSTDEEDEGPEPLSVSITLSKMSESHITLFVRYEMVLPAATMQNVVERQTEAALLGVSGLVREKYGGVVLW